MQKNLITQNPKISVAEFIKNSPAELGIELLAGASQTETKEIVSARIQKLGLALAGFAHYIHSGRIQIVGQSEIWYLAQLEKEQKIQAIRNLKLNNICCVLITKDLEPPTELIEIADESGLPILRTPQVSSEAISLVSNFLQETLALQVTIHGVFLGVFGLGVLLMGESGIGKSECALDLITRGHHLISDDSVVIKRIGEKLIGDSPKLTHEHLEIRGLGIINVRDLFGVSAIGNQKNVDICVELKNWKEVAEIERLGLETQVEEILGVKITKYVLPVSPGRNISTLVETAIRLHLLKMTGYDGLQKLIDKHTEILHANTNN